MSPASLKPKSITTADLPPLLDILANPEHPAFDKALARLSLLDPSTLTSTQAPALLARLQSTIAALAAQKALTAEQLANLRKRGNALLSYNSNR